jgi:hypothetical protein
MMRQLPHDSENVTATASKPRFYGGQGMACSTDVVARMRHCYTLMYMCVH